MNSYLISNINFHEFVESLVKALETKDYYTYGHSERVALLAERLAYEMNLEQKQIELTHIAAHLHDLGKIGIPDSILNKPGRLTEEEFKIMQEHSVKGFEILSKVQSLHHIANIVKHHHERYDGKGYPDGLKGKEIPLMSRIIAVADSFDAMTSTRPYRRKLEIDEAVLELEEHAKDQFDPAVIKVMINIYQNDRAFIEELVKPEVDGHDYLEVEHEQLYHSRRL